MYVSFVHGPDNEVFPALSAFMYMYVHLSDYLIFLSCSFNGWAHSATTASYNLLVIFMYDVKSVTRFWNYFKTPSTILGWDNVIYEKVVFK